MKSFTLVSALAAVGLVGATPAHSPAKRSLQPVKAKGNAFYVGDKRWYMRGLDYQPGGASANIDPLADPDICLRDIKEFKDLGINTIRVYAVDNSKDHDKCMAALDEAGIYLVLDVNNPEYSINRADPHISYNADYLQSVFATVEMFAKYDNVAAFFSGNEVINDEKDTDKAAPYVKAVTRDIKNYINSRGLRKIPVGYSAADVEQNRRQTADYFNCGSDDMRSDFFAFNDYSWCNSNYQTSGWDAKVKNFTDYGLPIFLSEWGCIKNRPREFEEIEAMMSKEMTKVYSGGLMYEYSLEDNNYGIVKIQNDKVNRKEEFKMFKDALKKYPTPTGDGGASSETHAVDCPPKDKNWQVDSKEIPNMPEQAQQYMKKGAGDGPGLKGKGSQTAGDSGTASGSAAEGKASPTGESQDDEDAAVSLNNMGMGSMVVTGVTMFMMLVGTAAL